MKHPSLSARDMAYISLSAGLLSISAWIHIPMADISFTLQTFAVVFLLDLLGGKRGTLGYLVYLGLGLVGLPVFSGFRGGISALTGVTGGYIWGMLLLCLIWWISPQGKTARFPSAVAGLSACYFAGTAWFWLIYTDGSAASLGTVILKCVVPYLVPDALKVLLALRLSDRLRGIVKL